MFWLLDHVWFETFPPCFNFILILGFYSFFEGYLDLVDFHRLMEFLIVIDQVRIYILLIYLLNLGLFTCIYYSFVWFVSWHFCEYIVWESLTFYLMRCICLPHSLVHCRFETVQILPLNASYFVLYLLFPIGHNLPATVW